MNESEFEALAQEFFKTHDVRWTPEHMAKIDACARAAHEVNRAYCAALGDHSQPPWIDAQAWQVTSARNGVMGVLKGNSPEQSHESWLAEKTRDGWRYVLKMHPCFMPYAELPEAQKKKDHLFVATVRAMAIALELPLVEKLGGR